MNYVLWKTEEMVQSCICCILWLKATVAGNGSDDKEDVESKRITVPKPTCGVLSLKYFAL